MGCEEKGVKWRKMEKIGGEMLGSVKLR